jgi:hypothetical protein
VVPGKPKDTRILKPGAPPLGQLDKTAPSKFCLAKSRSRQLDRKRLTRGIGVSVRLANRKLTLRTRGNVGCNHQQNHEQQDAICTSSGSLATNLPLLPHRLQLPVALRVDLLLPPRQHVLRRDVARTLFRRTLL